MSRLPTSLRLSPTVGRCQGPWERGGGAAGGSWGGGMVEGGDGHNGGGGSGGGGRVSLLPLVRSTPTHGK
jgi:hypothetical protein